MNVIQITLLIIVLLIVRIIYYLSKDSKSISDFILDGAIILMLNISLSLYKADMHQYKLMNAISEFNNNKLEQQNTILKAKIDSIEFNEHLYK